MVAKILGAQRDFSSGEIDTALKRSDEHPGRKTGLRQMSNMRILNSGTMQNRPGRSALFPTSNLLTRIEEFTIAAGSDYKIGFGAGRVSIINSVGSVVQSFTAQGGGAALPWTAGNLEQVVYAVFNKAVYITFAGMKPQVISWDGLSTWSIADYAEQVNGSQKRTPFYRLSPQNISIKPSARTGSVTVVASSAVFTAAHVGTRIRFVNRQLLITAYTDSTHVTATVLETLPGSQELTFGIDPTDTYTVGDQVIGSVSGSKGIVVSINSGTKKIVIQLLTLNSSTGSDGSFALASLAFTTSDVVAGPGGGLTPSGVAAITNPESISVWDDEIINAMRGYPASCFADQYRLGFCDFPQMPGAICWSAINAPLDLYANDASAPSNAIFEIAPENVRVFYVVAGAESSEFVFCDKRVYYIKIDASTPLKPGSVGFQILSSDGSAQVQPRSSQGVIIYANAGRNTMMGIIAPGNYYRPFNAISLSEIHGHLFTSIRAIAIPNADGTFNERYAYVLNADGSLIVGKYSVKEGQLGGTVGWGPWSGVGTVQWVAAWNSDILFTTSYFGASICETLDDTRYLDAALAVNSLPAAFTPPGGKGPLWWIPSQTVTLMDQVTRCMGTYAIDADGFIVPQFTGGEDLTAASLIAGQGWTSVIEPFCPDANPGQDVGQRMFKRRVSRFAAYVVHSTGFMMARLFAGPITSTSPALGTVMNTHRVTAYNQDDDPTKPPPERETAERWRPLGRAFDPRIAIIKDTPGPMQVVEIGMEATI